MGLKKPEQGISGTFLTYGPPPVLRDCAPLVSEMEKSLCRKENSRVVEAPYQSTIRIRNLGTGEIVKQSLDEQGSYRVTLVPGQYAVCVDMECSDPLEVRRGSFTTYGQRLPRQAGTATAKTDSTNFKTN